MRFRCFTTKLLSLPVFYTISDRIIQRSQWATLSCDENPRFLEIIIQLEWGQPAEASDKTGFPISGNEYIHAVNPGNLPIG
jgi:hypothetical protein